MSKYNHYMNSHFSGCRKLADARDNVRMRDVRLFELPGNLDHVGVSDGVDAWIAPVIAEPFSVNCRKLLNDLFHRPVQQSARRAKIAVPVQTEQRIRRVISA